MMKCEISLKNVLPAEIFHDGMWRFLKKRSSCGNISWWKVISQPSLSQSSHKGTVNFPPRPQTLLSWYEETIDHVYFLVARYMEQTPYLWQILLYGLRGINAGKSDTSLASLSVQLSGCPVRPVWYGARHCWGQTLSTSFQTSNLRAFLLRVNILLNHNSWRDL